MLIYKGSGVRFKMKEGGTIRARGAMLHDPKGQWWPRNSLLIIVFSRSGGRLATDKERDGAPKEYLGRTYKAHVNPKGVKVVPPTSLAEWEEVGAVEVIYYVRPGTKAPGRYYHDIGKRRIEAFFKSGKAKLYRRGSAYRVELGPKSIADDRGIVYP